MGRLTRDPSYREAQGEKGTYHIASFYLAVPKNMADGVNYIAVSAFGKQADFVKQYLVQGKRVAVTGELTTGTYTDPKTGTRMRSAEVTASRVEFADARTTSEDADFKDVPEEMEAEMPFR